LIDLDGHDEVVLMQSLDFLGLQGHCRIAPPEGDLGMMALGFREFADSDDKAQSFPEISEGKLALDAMRIVEQLPFPDIRSKSLGLIASERGNAASARRASLFRQGRHDCFPSRKAKPVAPAIHVASARATTCGKPSGRQAPKGQCAAPWTFTLRRAGVRLRYGGDHFFQFGSLEWAFASAATFMRRCKGDESLPSTRQSQSVLHFMPTE
jgi:hypothetical protein